MKVLVFILLAVFIAGCSGVKPDIRSSDPDERRTGIWELSPEPTGDDLEVVIRLLNDPDDLVRDAAITYLAKMGKGRFLPEVRVRLQDVSPIVRGTACRLVGELRDSESVGTLIKLLREDQEIVVRREALKSLSVFLNKEEALQGMKFAQSDKDPSIRALARHLLNLDKK
jgi:hypothetical protein